MAKPKKVSETKATSKKQVEHVAQQPAVPKYKTRATVDAELVKSENTIKDLTSELKTSNNNANTALKTISELQDTISKLNKNLVDTKITLKQSKAHATKVDKVKAELECVVDSLNDKVLKVQSQLKKSKSEGDNLEERNKIVSTTLHTTKIKLDISQKRRSDLNVQHDIKIDKIKAIINRPWYKKIITSSSTLIKKII